MDLQLQKALVTIPSFHLNHQICWCFEVQNSQNVKWFYEENIFLRTMTSNSLSENEDHSFDDHFWIAYLSFLYPNMCGFQYIWRVIWSPSETKL